MSVASFLTLAMAMSLVQDASAQTAACLMDSESSHYHQKATCIEIEIDVERYQTVSSSYWMKYARHFNGKYYPGNSKSPSGNHFFVKPVQSDDNEWWCQPGNVHRLNLSQRGNSGEVTKDFRMTIQPCDHKEEVLNRSYHKDGTIHWRQRKSFLNELDQTDPRKIVVDTTFLDGKNEKGPEVFQKYT